jgi:ribosomal protein S19
MSRSVYKISSLPVESAIRFTTSKMAAGSKFKTLMIKSFLKRRPDAIINRVRGAVLPNLVGKRVIAYNGNSFNSFSIRLSMVGLSFKNLIRTKRTGGSIHIEKKSKKKK